MVETLNEDRALKLNRVKAVEGERENLEGAKAEAEDFLTKEFQICQKQKVSYMLDCAESVKKKEEYGSKAEELESKLTERRATLEANVASESQSHMHCQRNLWFSGRFSDSSLRWLAELDGFETTYNAEYKEHAAIAKELAETKAEFASYEVSTQRNQPAAALRPPPMKIF